METLETRRFLSASISGTVYDDANGNHVRDAGEVAVVGQQVYLDLQGIDKFVAGDPVSTTDANGAYSFTGLAAGNYLVRPVPVAGKVTTTPIWGGKFFVQLGANQNATGDDFGIQTAGTPNFTVNGQLLIAGTANGQATLTRYNTVDGSTDVTFGSLGVVTLPASVTGQPTGAAAQGSNTVITYPTQIVTLDNSGNIVSITGGGTTNQGGASIRGTVSQITGSGQAFPAPGIQVYLDLNGIDTFVAGDPVVTTDSNGAYSFTGLAPGNYLVRVVPMPFAVTDSPVYGGKYFVQLGANQAVTGDNFNIRFVGSAFEFTVNNQIYVADSNATGNILTRYNADESRDVGFGNLGVVQLPAVFDGAPSSIVVGSGGNILVTYPTAPAPTVVTLSPTGAVLSSTAAGLNAPTNLSASASSSTSVQLGFIDNSTNDNGFVIERATSAAGPFASVGTLPGSVTGPTTGFVGFADNTAAPGTTYYYRVAAVNAATQSAYAGPVSVTTPAAGGATIAGTVYNDANNNGVQDAGELPVAGRQVYLDLNGIGVFANGDPITTTDATGHYSFTGLAASNYLVRLVPQTGTVITSPIWGGKYFVPLAANQVVTGDNFGTQAVADTSIHNVSLTLPDGRLLIARPQFIDLTIINSSKAAILTRYNADGSVDTTFGSAGSVSIPLTTGLGFASSFPKNLLELPTGNTLVVTEDGFVSNTNATETEFALVDPTGNVIRALTVATRSGSAGGNFGDLVNSESITADGKILAVGIHVSQDFLTGMNSTTPVTWRFNADLTPDTTFGVNGRLDG